MSVIGLGLGMLGWVGLDGCHHVNKRSLQHQRPTSQGDLQQYFVFVNVVTWSQEL
jgi:hypothetical protein